MMCLSCIVDLQTYGKVGGETLGVKANRSAAATAGTPEACQLQSASVVAHLRLHRAGGVEDCKLAQEGEEIVARFPAKDGRGF